MVSPPELPRRPYRPAIPPVFTLAGMAVAVMLSFGIGVAGGLRSWDLAVLGLALLMGFICAIPSVLDQARPPEQRQLLITLTAGVFFLFFVTPAFTQYFWIEGFQRGSLRLSHFSPPDIVAGQVASLVGLVCMLAGFYLPLGRFLSSFLPRPTHDWPVPAAIGIAAVMIPAGWAIFLGGLFGVIPKFVGNGFLGSIAFWTLAGIALLTLTYLRSRSRMAFIALLMVVPPTMAFNFFTGSKRGFLSPLFIVALCYILIDRRIRKSWLIAGFATLVILYPVSEFYRNVVAQHRTLNAVEILRNPGRAINQLSGFFSGVEAGEYFRSGLESAGSRLDALVMVTAIVRDTPEKVPYQYGWSIGLIFISYVPRVLWPGKPVTLIGEWVTENYGAGPGTNIENPTDMAPSWIGEFYFNFGYAGVIVGMLLIGMAFRIMQELLFRYDAPLPGLLGAVIITYFTARSVSGSLGMTCNSVVFNTSPIIALHVAVRLLFPAPRPALRASPAGHVHAGGRQASSAPGPSL